MTKKQLIQVTKELQELCAFEPTMRTIGTNTFLEGQIREATKSLLPEDKLSPLATKIVLKVLLKENEFRFRHIRSLMNLN